jgi:hypothetical protein
MRIPLPRTLTVGAFLAVMAFWVLMPARVTIGEAVLIQALRGVLSLVVTIMFFWSLISLWRHKLPDVGHALTAGIALAFAADVYSSILTITWTLRDTPMDWRTYPGWHFSFYLTSLAAILHIMVPGAINGIVPRRNVILVSCAIGLGVLLAGVVMFFTVDASWFPSL